MSEKVFEGPCLWVLLSLDCQPAILRGEQARALGYRSVEVAVFPPGEMVVGWRDGAGYDPFEPPRRWVQLRHPLAVALHEHAFPPRGERRWTAHVCEVAQVANDLSARDGLQPCYEVDPPWTPLSERALGACDSRVTLRVPCNGYRLPTTDEWEYAARMSRGSALWGTSADNLLAQPDPQCAEAPQCGSVLVAPNTCTRPEVWVTQGHDTPGVLKDILGNRAELLWSDLSGQVPAAIECSSSEGIVIAAGGMFTDVREETFVAGRMDATACDARGIGVRLVAGGNFAVVHEETN